MLSSYLEREKNERLVLFSVFILVFSARFLFRQISLWEWDEYLFVTSLYKYDLWAHIPHPPGYPLWVVLIRLSHKLFHNEVDALVFLNVFFGSLMVFPLYYIFRQVALPLPALGGTLLYLFNPAVWAEGESAFSDTTALFWFALALALLLRAQKNACFYLGCFLLAIALGIRAPDLFLAVFFLIPLWQKWRARDFEAAILGVAIVGFTCLAWLIPTAIYGAGGIKDYIQLIRVMGQSTATTDRWGLSLDAILARKWVFREMLVTIWSSRSLAILANLLAGVGLVSYVVRKKWWELFIIFVLFIPYFVFAFLFLELSYIKYAIPFIPFICLLVSLGVYGLASKLGPMRTLAFTTGLILLLMFCTAKAYPTLRLLHGEKSPIAQAVEYIQNHISPEKGLIYFDDELFPFARHGLKNFTLESLREFRGEEAIPPKPGMDAFVLSTLYPEPESTWRVNFKETSNALRLLGFGRLRGFFNNVWVSKTDIVCLYFVPTPGRTTRWMRDKGVCMLRNNGGNSDKVLSVQAFVPVSLFSRVPLITISLNDTPLAEFFPDDEQMVKVFSIPDQQLPANSWSKLDITSDQEFDCANSSFADEVDGNVSLRLESVTWADASSTAPTDPASDGQGSATN